MNEEIERAENVQGNPAAWARRMWPADHPIYRSIGPQFSYASLMMAIDSAWTCGYQRGMADQADIQPRVIEKRVTVTKRVDLDHLRRLAEAMDKAAAEKGSMLVDYREYQRRFFAVILEELESASNA